MFVVTGAGNGIGREVSLELLRRGARVAAVDLRPESLATTAELASVGHRLSVHTLDLTDREAVVRLPEQVAERHGHLDGLINVAGIIQRFVPFTRVPYEEMARVVDVNLWGTLHATKACLPYLLERPQACLVTISSVGGLLPLPGQTVYGASKAAVRLFTEGLYAELRRTAVAVSVVLPGAVRTEIAANSGVGARYGDEALAPRPRGVPFRALSPARVARAIVDQAVVEGRYRVTVGADAAVLDRLSRLAPQRATELVARKVADLLG